MKSLGFVSSMSGAFSGTGVFKTLKEHSFLRTLFHLAIMSTLVSFLMSAGEYNRVKNLFSPVKSAFYDAFGENILISSKVMIPERDPERTRTLALPDSSLLAYVGAKELKLPFSERDWSMAKNLILWTHQGVIMAIGTGENQWALVWQYPDSNSGWESELIGTDEIKKRFIKLAAVPPPPDYRLGTIVRSTATWFDQVSIGISVLFLFVNWLMVFFTALLYSGLFVGVFAISGLKRMRSFTWRSLWKTGIYASFPVSLIAGCFPAFELPGPGYSTVFMLGLMIYYLVIIAALERDNTTLPPLEGE